MREVDHGTALAVIGSEIASELLVVTCNSDGSIPLNARIVFVVANKDKPATLINLRKLVRNWNDFERAKP